MKLQLIQFRRLLPLIIFAFTFSMVANGQEKVTVAGIVNSTEGEPIRGVTVTAKNLDVADKAYNTTTDSSGIFRFTTMEANAKYNFTFSSVGYKTHTLTGYRINPNGKTSIVVKLVRDSTVLQDVVITGFQRIDKKKFTGAAVMLKSEDIKLDGVIDISRSLEGRAPGVSVQNVSGTFGSAPKIRIRGVTSISGDNKPFWVVDGIVLEDVINVSNDALSSGDPNTLFSSSVAGISMNDIEDFYILKDAAATSLYGARAANGVVVVTTKKGTAGRTRVTYTGNFSSYLKPSYKNFGILNSAEQMSMYAELFRKGYLDYASLKDAPNRGVFGKMYEQMQPDANGNFAVENTPEGQYAFLKKYAMANTNWFDVLFNNSLIQEHGVSVSTGSEKSQTYFSTTFYKDNGWTIADKVSRFTSNVQNTTKVSDKVTIGLISNASIRTQTAPGTTERVSDYAYGGGFVRNFDINPYNYALTTSRVMRAYDDNGNYEYYTKNYAPFSILNELKPNPLFITVLDLKASANLEYKFMKHFSYKFLGALRYVRTSQEQKALETSNLSSAYRAAYTIAVRNGNSLLYNDPNDPLDTNRVVMPYGGIYNRQELSLKSYDVRNEINYSAVYGPHTINVLAGQQISYADRQSFGFKGYGYLYEYGGNTFIDPDIYKKDLIAGRQPYGMNITRDRFTAVYIAPNYTFSERYNLSGSVRYEGSNRLGASKQARWLPTWTVAGSWNITEEDFMKSVKAINYWRFRASYGLTASMGTANNSSLVVYNGLIESRPQLSEREPYLYLSALANSDLTWEKMKSLNLGMDISTFSNRLQFTIDWFKKNNYDLIAPYVTGGTGGQLNKVGNVGTMKGGGLEFSVKGDIIKNGDWGWKNTLVFSYFKGKITEYKGLPTIFTLTLPEGGTRLRYPLNALFSVPFKGLAPFTGIPIIVNELGDETSRGLNNNSTNVQYLKYAGTTVPPYTGSMDNTFRYKGLSFSVYITYQAGNKIRLRSIYNRNFSDMDALSAEFLNRFTLPGDDKKEGVLPAIFDNLYGSQRLGSPYLGYNTSEDRVASGSFVRLKSLRLAYVVPNSFYHKIGLKDLSFSASMQNFKLLYADKRLRGQDPEFYNSGGVAQPIQTQVVLSVKAGF